MNSKEYWNSVSETKQFTTPFQFEQFKKYVSLSSAILDVGCGYGRTLHELYQHGYHNLAGIDFSEGMIQRGRAQFPELNLQVKTDSSINMPDNSMDAIILFAVLTCIISDEEQQELIAEVKRILKPGGILYINDFLLNDDERNKNRYEAAYGKYHTYGIFELPEGAVLRHHSENWIKILLSDFTMQEYEHLTFTTMNGHISNGFYFIGNIS